jgi:3-hydroxymyristoyl/3-hydroxydecanoyl-(acyl carrier protein) dehydratase
MLALTKQSPPAVAEVAAPLSLAARELYPLICVRDPYFAFQTFEVQSQTVLTTVAPEHPLGDEIGPIAAAEAGRHLAILGSCAAALENPTRARHYYLAREAYIERTAAAVPATLAVLGCSAKASFSDKRNASAQCVLLAQDTPLFSLDVSYSVLSESLFQRFYGQHEVAPDTVTPLVKANPYRSSTPLHVLQADDRRLLASMGVITKDMCAGHFQRFPCMPVAALMHCLSRAAGALFAHRAGAALAYSVEIAEVSARELAFAGASLQLEATHIGGHARGDKFSARAVSDAGKVIGELMVVLKPQDCVAAPSASEASFTSVAPTQTPRAAMPRSPSSTLAPL